MWVKLHQQAWVHSHCRHTIYKVMPASSLDIDSRQSAPWLFDCSLQKTNKVSKLTSTDGLKNYTDCKAFPSTPHTIRMRIFSTCLQCFRDVGCFFTGFTLQVGKFELEHPYSFSWFPWIHFEIHCTDKRAFDLHTVSFKKFVYTLQEQNKYTATNTNQNLHPHINGG